MPLREQLCSRHACHRVAPTLVAVSALYSSWGYLKLLPLLGEALGKEGRELGAHLVVPSHTGLSEACIFNFVIYDYSLLLNVSKVCTLSFSTLAYFVTQTGPVSCGHMTPSESAGAG